MDAHCPYLLQSPATAGGCENGRPVLWGKLADLAVCARRFQQLERGAYHRPLGLHVVGRPNRVLGWEARDE